MKKKIIPNIEPYLGKEEIKELKESIEAKWISGGPKLKEFQEKMAKICGVKHALGVCNGTQALYVGLMALGIGPGDEVIVPDFTFIASANAVFWTGARPVFVDVEKGTFNMDPGKIEKAITKKTKAILPVHIYGQAANMPAIMRIAEKHKLFVIEDAAQGVGVKYQKNPVGSFGNVGCLSFYADKVLTTGEGGMVLTNSENLAKKITILLNQGRTGRGWYIHDYIGYNFRMNDLQAAVGLAQLRKLPTIIKRKKRIEKLYREYLAKVPEVQFTYLDPHGFSVPYRIAILIKNPRKLMEYLEKRGIKASRTFYPLHLQPCYNEKGNFPNSLYGYERILNLPSATSLTREEIKYICDKIREFFKK